MHFVFLTGSFCPGKFFSDGWFVTIYLGNRDVPIVDIRIVFFLFLFYFVFMLGRGKRRLDNS